MLLMVRHHWPGEVRFDFNCYNHYMQLPPQRMGKEPVIIMRREGVRKGDPLYMVLYGITLAPLAEELRASDPDLIAHLYAKDAVFDRPSGRSARLLILLLERGMSRG